MLSGDGLKQLRERLSGLSGAGVVLLEAGDTGKRHLRQLDLSGADLRGLRLSGVYLEDVVLRGADLRGAVLEDVVFSGCDLTGARLEGSVWERVLARYVIADDTSWDGAEVHECHFLGSFRRARFGSGIWDQVHFYTSDLRDSLGAVMEGTVPAVASEGKRGFGGRPRGPARGSLLREGLGR